MGYRFQVELYIQRSRLGYPGHVSLSLGIFLQRLTDLQLVINLMGKTNLFSFVVYLEVSEPIYMYLRLIYMYMYMYV